MTEAIVAFDYGRARIGWALADPTGITVRGLETLSGGPTPEAAGQRAAAAVRETPAGQIVVGLPLHEDGAESGLSAEARRFGAALEAASGLPVVFHDETLTSWEAEEALKARGVDLRKARQEGLIDREAACALLRGWLAARP